MPPRLYGDSGGASPRADDHRAILSVSDTGIVIPSGTSATHLSYFPVACAIVDRSQGGSVIGLSVSCVNWIEMHGERSVPRVLATGQGATSKSFFARPRPRRRALRRPIARSLRVPRRRDDNFARRIHSPCCFPPLEGHAVQAVYLPERW